MPIRVSWDRYEVALLFAAYERVAGGSDINTEAAQLSQTLRNLAIRRGVSIDDTYRNLNGMKMQLANVQYLFTSGEKGLSGASAMIRQMYELYKSDQTEYQEILKEAIRMTGNTTTSVEDAFFAYAKGKIGLSPAMLTECLRKAADYCHLKQPLLGMTDVKAVRNVQQKVAEGKLLRFRFGKDAQTIRNVTQLYYTFIKGYREPKEEPIPQSAPPVEPSVMEPVSHDATNEPTSESSSSEVFPEKVDTPEKSAEPAEVIASQEETSDAPAKDQLQVDFNQDNSYLFTKPISYSYKGKTYPAKSWNRIYVEICGLLFADHRDAFMGIMNGDIPGGYSALAFADERNYRRMRVPKSFAPGYYLESNLDATSIVRKLRGLHQLFNVGDDLQITYQTVDGYQPTQPKEHRKIGAPGQTVVDNDYNWHRPGLLLVDLTREESYTFTQPEAYEYRGTTRRVIKWGKLYADLCGLLFEDYHDAFMDIMNGDIPGYNALAFADEQHKSGMRVARQFAPGYYLESNIDATTIVRRIRGLSKLFNLGNGLRISYTKTGGSSQPETPDDPGEEWIIRELRTRNIRFVDNRSVDGCLWIASDMSIPIPLNEAADKGYHLRLKQDGCRAYPDRPVLWTKDRPIPQVKHEIPGSGNESDNLQTFKHFLLEKQHLAERTAGSYCTSIRMIEEYIRRNNLNYHLIGSNADEMQVLFNILIARPDFDQIDKSRHRQFRAAMQQYIMFLHGEIRGKPDFVRSRELTIKQAVVRVLTEEGHPLTAPEILQRIQDKGLYTFNSQSPLLMVYDTIRKSCQGAKTPGHMKDDIFVRVDTDERTPHYYLLDANSADVEQNSNSEEDIALRNRILDVAAEAFPNGMRPGSIIDLNRLKRSYVNRHNEEIPESTDIASLLTEAGIRSGEKIYIIGDEQKSQLRDLIESIFAKGCRVIYYSELLRQHGSLLESCHLFEAALMRTVFTSLFPAAICKAEWMLADRSANEIEEVTRAFGEDLVLTYGQIKDRCPYLTLGVIKWALSRSSRFVWSSSETFAQTDLIQLDEEEVQKVRQDVLPKLKADGYYSLARLPLEDSCALNPQISVSAVRDAMFIRHMAVECDRNGLIATPKGVKATSAQLLEGWCREHDELNIDELEAYERELTGHHAVLGIWVACHNMVRIDHDHFVSDALIDFDIDETDRAIALFAGNHIIPITAITSFTSFPEVEGYTWNLYLVESFLRRFSRRFTIDGGPAQMSYVGGICPVSMRFDSYEDRLAQAVIQDNVLLTEESVGRYLTEKKYILRRSDTVRKVLQKAHILKEQGGDSSVRL